MMNKLKRKSVIGLCIRYFILIAVCGTIFWFSAQNADDSSAQSGRVVDLVIRCFFPNFIYYTDAAAFALRRFLTVAVRKAAHFSIFCILGMSAFSATIPINKRWLRFICGLGFCFAYACADEFHQTAVAGRAGLFTDVLIDTSGAFTGCLLALCAGIVWEAHGIIKQRKREQQEAVN